MKAVRIHAFGGPEVVTYEEAPKPEPKANEVLFRVTSTCINYADVQWRLGNYVDRTLPAQCLPPGVRIAAHPPTLQADPVSA